MSGESKKDKGNKNAGHRNRLRKRYIQNGINSLEEHEIIELLLFYCIPRKDTKDKAKELIETLGGFSNVFDANPEDLINLGKVSYNTSVLIKLINDITKKYEEDKFGDKYKVTSSASANAYIRSIIKFEKVEKVVVVCLNRESVVLGHEIISKGSIDEVIVYTRHIIEVALRYNAVSIILAHNHPSGNPLPSREDEILTNRVYKALAYAGIKLVDHIIIGGREEEYYSFLGNNNIEKEL